MLSALRKTVQNVSVAQQAEAVRRAMVLQAVVVAVAMMVTVMKIVHAAVDVMLIQMNN